jgi:predicted DsbA family dithiol-disulfide isomerase
MYKWAEQTGLSKEKFKQCYDNEEEMDEVNQDKQEAGENNVEATPTILINDQKLAGAQPYSRFESTIESVLQ